MTFYLSCFFFFPTSFLLHCLFRYSVCVPLVTMLLALCCVIIMCLNIYLHYFSLSSFYWTFYFNLSCLFFADCLFDRWICFSLSHVCWVLSPLLGVGFPCLLGSGCASLSLSLWMPFLCASLNVTSKSPRHSSHTTNWTIHAALFNKDYHLNRR